MRWNGWNGWTMRSESSTMECKLCTRGEHRAKGRKRTSEPRIHRHSVQLFCLFVSRHG